MASPYAGDSAPIRCEQFPWIDLREIGQHGQAAKSIIGGLTTPAANRAS